MSASDFLRYRPIPLFHGRQWGKWWLDVKRLCLVYQPEGRSGGYEVDIEQINSSAEMLDWIFQINNKGWASAKDIADLLEAFGDIFYPQANLCSGGVDSQIENPTAFLRQRVQATDEPEHRNI
jgi:hypothetical protein